jgi:uncharacterized membrane protein
MMDYGDMGGYAWVWMTLGVVFWIAIAALVVGAIARTDRWATPAANAEEILRRRYASGEIGAAEFESARRALRNS